MRVTMERSGGFAGMTRIEEIDTDSLPVEDAESLRGLLERVDFFEQAEVEASPGEALPDTFVYAITVQNGKRTHTVRRSEGSSLQPLIDLLRELGRGRGNQEAS